MAVHGTCRHPIEIEKKRKENQPWKRVSHPADNVSETRLDEATYSFFLVVQTDALQRDDVVRLSVLSLVHDAIRA